MSARGDDERGDDDAKSGAERWVLPYFEDSSLWPVLAVVVAALAAFLAPVLLRAARGLDLRALAATALAAYGSFRALRWEWQLRGRPGALGGAVALVWALAVVAAWYGARSGLL